MPRDVDPDDVLYDTLNAWRRDIEADAENE
jgi:hypothetical protein